MRFSPVSQHSFTFRMLIVFLGTILFALILSSNAWCAMVSGNVTEESGKGVAGVKISIADPTSGKTIGQAVTDASGKYQIPGITPGTYDFAFDPIATGFKPGAATTGVPNRGLTVNWIVSSNKDAVAFATAGVAVAGIGTGTAVLAGVGAAVVAGSVVGGLDAAGAFGGGGNGSSSGPGPVQSPSF
jgi:hypothetical protein